MFMEEIAMTQTSNLWRKNIVFFSATLARLQHSLKHYDKVFVLYAGR